MEPLRNYWSIFALVTGFKLLLMPAYFSTDFEVHRNWLAITYSLPLKKWYYEQTSQWTLDYPPFFAYFEWFLSQFAQFFDPEMLEVENLDYASPNTIIFQRVSVMVTDVIYLFGVKGCLETIIPSKLTDRCQYLIAAGLLLGNIGLIMVDHIHFQYNGVLFGILLLSIMKILQGKYIQATFLFTYLLHMKHIFIYVAPVYVVFLLKFYVFQSRDWYREFSKLALTVLGVTSVSLGPFIEHIPQLLKRLFPFKRGLTHAYWAPNFWAIYNFVDKVASVLLKKGGVGGEVGAGTGGLVKEYIHQVLPQIPPILTFCLTLIFMIPCLIKLWTFKKETNMTTKFIRAIVICACTSFLFGWHVHEKAILMVLIPLSLLATLDIFDARMTLFLSSIGYYSLFPLLFKADLIFIKIGLFGMYIAGAWCTFDYLYKSQRILKLHELIYLFGFTGLWVYENAIHFIIGFHKIYPFLPLMLTSVYCGIGVIYFYIIYYYNFLTLETSFGKPRSKTKTKTIGSTTGATVKIVKKE